MMKKQKFDKPVRRICALSLAGALLALSLAACGGKKDAETGTDVGASEQDAEVRDASAGGTLQLPAGEDMQIVGEGEADARDAEDGAPAKAGPEEDAAEEVPVDEDGNPLSAEDIAAMDGEEDFVPGAPSPFTEYGSLDDFARAAAEAGIDRARIDEVANPPMDVTEVAYLLYEDGMYEIRYTDASGAELSFRKSAGTKDNSGIYVEFEEETGKKIGDREVTLCGDGGEVILATWTDGDYAYSLYADPGYMEPMMVQTVESVQPVR